jgi:hypothetical protein
VANSFLELIDNALGTHFNAPVYDPKAGRKKLVKAIEAAANQHSENRIKVPNRAWAVGSNKAIRYSPTLKGQPILIGDKAENYVPSERFGDFLDGFKTAVEAGDFDDQIEAALSGESSTETRGGKASTSGRGGAGRMRKSSLPARADGIEHRVLASEEQPHKDYTLNKAKTYWRSPEQVADDEKRSAQRLASMKAE